MHFIQNKQTKKNKKKQKTHKQTKTNKYIAKENNQTIPTLDETTRVHEEIKLKSNKGKARENVKLIMIASILIYSFILFLCLYMLWTGAFYFRWYVFFVNIAFVVATVMKMSWDMFEVNSVLNARKQT